MSIQSFHVFLIVMAIVAVVVFVSLFFVDAGYGKLYDKYKKDFFRHLDKKCYFCAKFLPQ